MLFAPKLCNENREITWVHFTEKNLSELREEFSAPTSGKSTAPAGAARLAGQRAPSRLKHRCQALGHVLVCCGQAGGHVLDG
ncbi:MAG: hypothetical protein R6U40_06560, partial [Desulfobacterales bacterium]